MAEVTNERIYEALRQIQSDEAGVKAELRQTNVLLDAIQSQLIALQHGVQSICTLLGSHDARLDRIERLLNLVEVA